MRIVIFGPQGAGKGTQSARIGEKYGIPVLAVTAVGKDMARDVRYLGLACRIAAELGAHIVKTYYCDDFEQLIESCPIPVIVAGGKKISEMEALDLTYNSVKRGAVGVDMGRNIFQSEDPVAMIQAVGAVVHRNEKPEKAFQLYQQLKARNVPDRPRVASKA